MNDRQPSILKIIWIDYLAFLSAVSCLVAVGMQFYDVFLREDPAGSFTWVAWAILLSGIVGVGLRYVSIVSLYNSGLEARGTVSEVGFFRDRGYIKYIYPYENKRYAGRLIVMKNRMTTRYQTGSEVDVIVDRENPKKSIIKDLFV